MECELEKWLAKMNYPGKCPESLTSICNNSTSYIWEQLIHNARPKDEVQRIRRNVVIKRLMQKPLSDQNAFAYPIQEISMYNKKIQLQNKRDQLEKINDEQRLKIHRIAQNNKVKYMEIEREKFRIKENTEKELLLKKRCVLLENNIKESNQFLGRLPLWIDVQLGNNSSDDEIQAILNRIKLEDYLKKIPLFPNQSSYASNHTYNTMSAQKAAREGKTFQDQFIELDSRFHLTVSTKKSNSCKKIGSSAISTVTRCLFNKGKENINTPEGMFETNVSDSTCTPKQPKRRETFGLINDSYMDDSPFFNNENISNNSIVNILKEIDQNSGLEEHGNSINNRRTAKTRTSIGYNNSLDNNNNMDEHIEMLHQNKMLNDLLIGPLKTRNPQIIWTDFQAIENNLHVKISKKLFSAATLSKSGLTKDDIAQLHIIHLQTELNTRKLNRTLKNMIEKINKKKQILIMALKALLSNKQQMNEEQELNEKLTLWEQNMIDIGWDGTLCFMMKEVNKAENYNDNKNLHTITQQLHQIKEKIGTKIQHVDQRIKIAQNLFKLIKMTNDSTCATLHRLIPFVSDIHCRGILMKNVWSEENRVFACLPPLEYHRRLGCFNGDGPFYYRDICKYSFPQNCEMDDENMYMFTEILDSPFSPPEHQVLNILKIKMKMNIMNSLQTDPSIPKYEKYTSEDLQKQESYIDFVIERLNTLLHSSSSQKTLAYPEDIKNIIEIWSEMPFTNYISANKLIDGNDYKFYEKRYDSFYKNL